ncbi:AfsR/SARP family transcriptional regulator [Streptomyces murinus]|uniref:AfsR/SARP family transcriptional regulator n=1 Tax=Streptomyces murinus TaxID=33900 RepID=UPI000A1EF6AB|nr:tetratricopeptide repeat protein [Streptomyces murinus]
MEFEIRLSGSVEVRVGGRAGPLGPTKSRAALAALAWDAGRSVSVDSLVHRIWDDHPPATARETLHTHISRVRRALRTADPDAPTITSRTNSYVLHVDPDRVDLRAYTSCVEQARALKGSDDDAALQLLERADAHRYGEPLAGISGSWPDHLRATVGETALIAAMTRAELLMNAGRFTEAVPVLAPLAPEHPVDEALVGLLAVALHGGGRTAEATKLLQRTRQRVIRDIGLDGGRRLHRIQEGILAGTPAGALYGQGPRRRPTARPGRPVPDNLPRDVPWIGRREELRRLTSALSEGGGESGAVVTVEGMGGVGKSALAVHCGHEVADRYPDGRCFVRLGGHAADRTAGAPDRALTTLLRVLGPEGRELPQDTEELTAMWRSLARDRRMLVILDDAVCSEQVRQLLPGASPTSVVVTSRRRLTGLPGARSISLDVLPSDDAIALFERRLGAGGRSRTAEIADIVRVCGHLPLAVEIAASRLLARSSWTAADLLRQLTAGAGGLDELRDGERTLEHVFALSYRALTAEQQLVFRRISLHAGMEFGPHAVAALTGLPLAATERALEQLLTQHLLSEPAPHRFTLHDLLRTYARSLSDAEETESRAAMARLATFYMGAADRADRLVHPYRSRTSLDADDFITLPEINDVHAAEQWLLTESGNLSDTLEWISRQGSERQLALSVHVLTEFLDTRGRLTTTETLLRRAVAHWAATGDRKAQARALLDLGVAHSHRSRYDEAISAAREALELARALGDSELECECVNQLCIPLWQTGQYGLVQALQEQILDSRMQMKNGLQAARSYNILGSTYLSLAKNDAALTCFNSALSEFTAIGHERGIFVSLNNLAEVSTRTGDLGFAEIAYRKAISLATQRSDRREQATLQMNLANALIGLGQTEEALTLSQGSLEVFRAMADRRREALALNRIGKAHRAAGRSEQAVPLHVAALTLARRINAAGEVVDTAYDAALAELDTGRAAQAMAHLEESLAMSKQIGAPAEAARASRTLATLRAVPRQQQRG